MDNRKMKLTYPCRLNPDLLVKERFPSHPLDVPRSKSAAPLSCKRLPCLEPSGGAAPLAGVRPLYFESAIPDARNKLYRGDNLDVRTMMVPTWRVTT